MTEKQSKAPVQEPARAQGTAGNDKIWSLRGKFPTLVDLLVFFGIFLLAQVFGGAAALIMGYNWPDVAVFAGEDQAALLAEQLSVAHFNAISYFVAMSLTLGGYLFYRSRRGGRGAIAHFSLRGLNPVLLLWGIFFMLATSVVLEPVLNLLPDVPNVYGRGVWAFLTLVVMAPLFEEVIFRGVILESARAKYGVMAAWLLSSLVFGLVHLHPTVVVNAFVVGLVFGFIYIKSGSLWSSIILHAVNNGIAFLLLAYGQNQTMLIDLVGNRTLYVVIYIVAAAAFVGSGYMMLRKLRSMKDAEKNQAQV